MNDKILEMYDKRPRLAWLYFLITAVIISLIIYSANGMNFTGITDKGSEIATGMIHGLTHPDTALLFSTASDGVPYLILQTIAIAILGTFLVQFWLFQWLFWLRKILSASQSQLLQGF